MTEPRVHRFFLVRRPTSRIREVSGEIRVCEKMTWAVVKRRRYLIGATVFYTEKSAMLNKLGRLRKLEETLPRSYAFKLLRREVVQQLDMYKNTGAFH